MSRFMIVLSLALLSLTSGAVETTTTQSTVGVSTSSPSQTTQATDGGKRNNHGQKVKEVAAGDTKGNDKHEENREVRQERREQRQVRRDERRERREQRRAERLETKNASTTTEDSVVNGEKHEGSSRKDRESGKR